MTVVTMTWYDSKHKPRSAMIEVASMHTDECDGVSLIISGVEGAGSSSHKLIQLDGKSTKYITDWTVGLI